MTSRRLQKLSEAIREVVSWAIIADLKDPRIENVTVTYVEVSGDMRQATVHVSIMGDEKKQTLCLHGLSNAAGFLQQKISNRIETRYIPKIKFKLDQGVKHSIEINRILDEVLPTVDESSSQIEPLENNSSQEEISENRPMTDSPEPSSPETAGDHTSAPAKDK